MYTYSLSDGYDLDQLSVNYRFGNSANITGQVEALLDIESGFVVEIGEPNIRNDTTSFYASFPLSISGKSYTLSISGNHALLTGTGPFNRRHPFLEDSVTTRSIIAMDLKPEMVFTLLSPDGTILRTNEIFWQQLRNRIPASHPLCTNRHN